MHAMIDEAYVVKLSEIISQPLTFETFEGILRSNIPELYRRSRRIGTLQCSHAELVSFLEVLRAKLYRYLKEGHLLENNYINLWFLFSQTTLSHDVKLSSLIPLFEKTYATYDVTQKERFIFAHLLFVLRMANGEGVSSLLWFMGEHLWFDGKSYHVMDADAQALRSFCESFEIPGEWVIKGLADSLDVERFLNASYTTRMGISTWILGFFWQIKGFENHLAWRDILYPVLKQLFFTCKNRGMIEEMMSLHFLISHLATNRMQTQEEMKAFNHEIEECASAFYAMWGKNNHLVLSETALHVKNKIALIKDRIVENSPFKVEFSLLSALANNQNFREQYELVIYSMGTIEKSLDDVKCIENIRNLGFDVRLVAFESLNPMTNFQSQLTRALALRNDMQKHQIHTMIVANNNTPIASFLFATRSCEKQIFWSHGNFAYDVSGIDKRVSHFPFISSFHYCIFSVPMLSNTFYTPHRRLEHIETERKKYPHNALILGTIGRLIKVNDEQYLETIAQIMKHNPQTIYIAAGSGELSGIRQKVTKLGIADRFYTPGFVDPHIYGNIIDIWLDTFPLGQGESLNEFIAKSKPFVPLSKGYGKTLDITEPEMYQHMITTYPELCFHNGENLIFFHEQRKCYTIDGYIACANDLINDTELCTKLGKMITTLLNEIALRDKKKSIDAFISCITH